MDKEMPQMDGYQTTVVLRENIKNEINSIPIIGVSGHSIKHQNEIYDAMGFNGYVTKPFKKEEIYEIIYKVLQLKKS